MQTVGNIHLLYCKCIDFKATHYKCFASSTHKYIYICIHTYIYVHIYIYISIEYIYHYRHVIYANIILTFQTYIIYVIEIAILHRLITEQVIKAANHFVPNLPQINSYISKENIANTSFIVVSAKHLMAEAIDGEKWSYLFIKTPCWMLQRKQDMMPTMSIACTGACLSALVPYS